MNAIPTISNGMDIQSIAGMLLQQLGGNLATGVQGTPFDIHAEKMNRRLAELPSDPDETLR
jgi:hypothetical protein